MKTTFLWAFAAAMLAAGLLATESQAGNHRNERVARQFAQARPWHGGYAYTPYGEPLALVVPPQAGTMVSYGWGVTGTEVRPLHHQYGRSYPGGGYGGWSSSPYRTTPQWPSHTDQFGVYPVRGPWR